MLHFTDCMLRADSLKAMGMSIAHQTFKVNVPKKPAWFWETLIALSILAAASLQHFGAITALDAAALTLSPVIFSVAWKNPDLKRFGHLTCLWLVAIVLSDQIHRVPIGNTVSSLILPALLMLSTVAMAWVARGSRGRMRAVIVAAMASHIVFNVIYGTTYFSVNPWKYGLALPVTVLALGLFAGVGKARTLLSVGILAASGAYSFLNDFRSMSGLALAAIVLILFLRRPPKPGRKFAMTKLFVGLIVVGYAAYGAYAFAASEGMLPAEAAAKYQMQVRQGNLLIAARPEIVGSLHAIQTSPLVGLGTGGQLDSEARSDVFSTLYEAGATVNKEQQLRLFENGVNSHSLLFSSWVSAGILGALPWAFLIFLAMRAIAKRTVRGGFAPLAVFWGLATSWDVLFSPYQPHLHIVIGAFVVLMTWQEQDPGDAIPPVRANPAAAADPSLLGGATVV